MGELEHGRERRRSQLGRVAIDVAATVGYDAMSIRDIADAVSRGEVRSLPSLVGEWVEVATAPYAVIARGGAGMGAAIGVGEVVERQSTAGAGVGSGCVGR